MAKPSCFHLSQSNPSGPGQGDPAALLRRVADTIDGLGDVWIQDIVYHCEQTDHEEDLHITVYYHDEPRPQG